MFAQFQASLPRWAAAFLERLGISNFAAVREMLSEGITSSFRTVATQALQIGQSDFSFLMALGVMLYLTFFLLRGGPKLAAMVERAPTTRTAHRPAWRQQLDTGPPHPNTGRI